MRLRFGRLKGMEVVADKEGRLLGSVRKLLLDSKRKTALGVVFKSKALSAERWAKLSAVTRVGEDILFLGDSESVRDDAPPGRDIHDMLGLSVTSMDGKRLGSLEDVVLDPADWNLCALVLDNGGEVDLDEEAVLGEDTVLLRKGAGDQIRPASPQGGFLARVFHSEPPPEPEVWNGRTPRKGKRRPKG